jgi:hypothetical protein
MHRATDSSTAPSIRVAATHQQRRGGALLRIRIPVSASRLSLHAGRYYWRGREPAAPPAAVRTHAHARSAAARTPATRRIKPSRRVRVRSGGRACGHQPRRATQLARRRRRRRGPATCPSGYSSFPFLPSFAGRPRRRTATARSVTTGCE